MTAVRTFRRPGPAKAGQAAQPPRRPRSIAEALWADPEEERRAREAPAALQSKTVGVGVGVGVGAPVFVLTLPLKLPQGFTRAGKAKPPLNLCPTLNEYNGMPGWLKKKVRERVDFLIADTFGAGNTWLGASLLLFGGKKHLSCGVRRRVVVTRHSSREPDELAVDVIGGKIPIDRLVKLGVLAGDSRKWLEREAHWKYAKPGEGKLVVEVHDL